MTKKNTSASLYESVNYTEFPISSVLSVAEKQEDKQCSPFINKYALGLIVLLTSVSTSTDVKFDNATGFHNSSTLVYSYSINDLQQESDILHGFISNLLVNSEDLDSKIVDMVNENFWDLI
jgi:hypothetical protein